MLLSPSRKILSWKVLSLWRKTMAREGIKVLATNGCFDLLHVGHVDYLRKAHNMGGVLIVGVNADASVRALKGSNRPINTAEHRATVLAALEYVDAVTIFNGRTAERFLAEIKPDVWIKGGDYSLDTVDQGERRTVEKEGGTIVFIPFTYQISTTQLLKRV